MEYKYNLAKLQYDKEKMEELITRHNRRIGQVFPQKLEQEFWRLNLERARRNINDFLWSGVLAYFIFAILTIPGDYWIIEQSHFKQDFIHCLLGLLNGAVCLLFLYVFSHFVKLKPFFAYAAMFAVFWAVVSTTWLTISVHTEALRHQAMMIICMIYVLGYLLTGVKPGYVFMTGMAAAGVSFLVLISTLVKFDAIVMGRVMFGSCLLGFIISRMIYARERIIFLNIRRAKISEKIHRIHTSELLHLSQNDELTKISNRRNFDEMMDTYYEQSRQDETPLSILFIDVDFFKKYNDCYGHQKGDDVISSIAKSIKNAIRHMDFVARYGGEEFVVLLPETDAHGAYAVASNIYRAIERLEIPHQMSEVSPFVTISLGITVFKGEVDLSKVELLGIADQALYRAKQLGRNQIYYQPLTTSTCIE
ncbi:MULTISPECIES: GGDEF domain-containing protein [Acinetobacter]|uniref:diguanylate cyclase n=1 Tax=Acinetobacter johnsonii TaxID=40214 RepID=A0AAJ6LCF7_ACIJO|nr:MULTISPECIES: GGDEF domain-containing protein [Acinetobacter]NWK63116.1 GGDEF domain-containing protein [Acinetobacter sp. SwsAc3]ALV73391.1 diguanylate cyclase [Acinetobacter johnsonii XBB1]MCV2452011.1 GGDEF domain-containing protein [Acinetobacter johnsonii]MDG9787773.1 GGDEF domain-containing protein [Acinetobacter johnsonii]MDG9799795.1 GGDEF domain-containing protein [Acinetobacter johnsonii]